MAIRIEERFQVKAPVEATWAFLVDPRRVVTCLPGAELTDVKERTFLGAVKVKVGSVTVAYKGKVTLDEIDVAAHRVRMSGEGRESAGAGSARMRMESRVTPLPDGGAEVVVQSDVDVVGRIVQLGRGMIEQVSHQVFQQFAGNVRRTLESEAAQRAATDAAAAAGAPAPAAAPPAPRAQEPLRALPLLFRALWAWILSLFRPGQGGAPKA